MKSTSEYKFSIPYLVALLLHIFFSSKSILANSIISILIIGLLLLSTQIYYRNQKEIDNKRIRLAFIIFAYYFIIINAIEILHYIYVGLATLN